MDLRYTPEENERLIISVAGNKAATSDSPAKVVLITPGKPHHVLCECAEEADALLIKKLFNNALSTVSS